MKYKSLHISVPRACHESWDSMTATEKGAFCQSCQKEVIDFSAMTDREVIEYLEKNKTQCGRFRKDQVESPLVIHRIDNGFMKWKAFVMGLLPLFTVKIALASKPSVVLVDQVPISKKDSAQYVPVDTNLIVIMGTVYGEKNKPLPYARIRLLDASMDTIAPQCQTDTAGNFSFVVPKSLIKGNREHLRIKAWGYEVKDIYISNEPIQKYPVKLKIYKEAMVMGMMG